METALTKIDIALAEKETAAATTGHVEAEGPRLKSLLADLKARINGHMEVSQKQSRGFPPLLSNIL